MNKNHWITEIREELTGNILPFWMAAVDPANGGFLGRITGDGVVIPDAPKGAVLNARILWTFSSAYRVLDDTRLLAYANRAKDYLLKYFFDKRYGGIYWMLDHKGNPLETKKQIYAQAFAIYSLCEYFRAIGDETALIAAVELFNKIEEHSFDREKNGYFEAFREDWTPIEDMRLSDKDANEAKTMNTHLHILEAYTNLCRVWKSTLLEKQLENLIRLFLSKFLDPETGHLHLFFDADWRNNHRIVSYGHDIEMSWLLYEAATVLGNHALLKQAEEWVPKIADVCREGVQSDGSMAYELHADTGRLDTERHWWVQAEMVVGYLNAYELTGNPEFQEIARNNWTYIKYHLIDREHGEWFWSAYADGTANRTDDKLSLWKCPYHNGRMCLEVLERTKMLTEEK